jgi:amino acid adenylation domain-containing protein
MTEDTANRFQGSPQQEEQWRQEPAGPAGRIQALVELDGPLDRSALADALRRVVRRHESLRTTFASQVGILVPLQVINDDLEPGWVALELPDCDPAKKVADALALERGLRFDYERGPLVRGRLMRFAAERHVLLLTVSTLCIDVASIPLLIAELARHYNGAAPTVEDPLQYADFSAWQSELSASDDDAARVAREVWTKLSGASAPQLPFAHQSTASFLPDEVALELPGSATPELVHAAWHALLGRLTGERNVIVEYLTPDRRHADLEGAIGAFARPVPLSVDVDGEATFATLIDAIGAARAKAAEWQDYAPAETMTPLTVGFSDYEGYRGDAGELSISLERIVSTGNEWRLWLSVPRDEGPRSGSICFDPASYDRESVERLAGQLERLVAHAVSDPSTPVAALPLLDDAELARILKAFNDSAAPEAKGLIHERFAAEAAAAPSRIAVIDELASMSYAELDSRANQLAHRLRTLGVGPEATVGLCTDRSVEMVVGVLGILKAGGAYIPLNYEHPPARLAAQLEIAGARVIVTQSALLDRLPEFDGELICLDGADDLAVLRTQPETAPADVGLSDENLAYVIYTSGSTGAPKGVAVTHGNVANYVADIARRLGAELEPLVFGLVTSIATDLGNTSVFGALGSGGTLALVSPATSADPNALARRFQAVPVDVLKITPSHIGALLVGDDPGVLPRKTLVVGGERAPWDLVRRVGSLSSCAVLNHYGPTETTIGCCTFAVGDGPGPYEPATVPIGRPISNTSCYVLDARMQPVPIGVPGTLFVGGEGVARGYIGAPELTREAFLEDPFTDAPGTRMYNTGDVVRWLPDGTLEFLGRVDEQVKIRGYRVEPAEVETALRSHPAVGEAVVVTSPAPSGEHRLVAYCTTVGAADEHELRSHLAQLLPEFMLPSAIVTLDAMPRTPSGKVDRLSLPDPETVAEPSGPAYVAPRTPVEQAIVAVWSKILGVEKIGVEDDFFELGGHSLLATQVVAQVRSELAVDLPLHSLFTCPTVELLAAEIMSLMGGADDETASLLAELEGLSDEEAERLLADETTRPADGQL